MRIGHALRYGHHGMDVHIKDKNGAVTGAMVTILRLAKRVTEIMLGLILRPWF